MVSPTPTGITRSLLRRELDQLDAYMERALFFFHVAPALVRSDDRAPERAPRPAVPSRPGAPRQNPEPVAARPPRRGARIWFPAFF